MEWRQIDIRPKSMTGTIIKKSTTYFGIVRKSTVVRAYTYQDVSHAYFAEKSKALKSHLCKFVEFETKNSGLLEAMERIAWTVENIDCLGKLWVPISDEQLEFEALEPFLKLACFETFTFEQQLLVLKSVKQEAKTELLNQVSKQRQLELLEAVTAPFEKKEQATST